ncbi:10431_t:CDS:2 [Gigaspora rosea]|nr:10431_t:CDS:2 [Gigaspora rosea]
MDPRQGQRDEEVIRQEIHRQVQQAIQESKMTNNKRQRTNKDNLQDKTELLIQNTPTTKDEIGLTKILQNKSNIKGKEWNDQNPKITYSITVTGQKCREMMKVRTEWNNKVWVQYAEMRIQPDHSIEALKSEQIILKFFSYKLCNKVTDHNIPNAIDSILQNIIKSKGVNATTPKED